MTDWSNAWEEADLLLAAAGAVESTSARGWARLDRALGEVDAALDGRDLDALRRTLHALEDSLPSERMRMLGGPGLPVPPPSGLADRIERLVTRIRVAAANDEDAPVPVDSTESAGAPDDRAG
ncbi:CATRA system-associated protein [Streptomyces sp. NPDC014734]|uniref:CATRA system-associated protein n=1 Tax=Streptomyces sp. NPDC014734 TaxID=3364886 RepID=UPI0036FBCF9E